MKCLCQLENYLKIIHLLEQIFIIWDGRIYFLGEMWTFYPGAGYGKIEPEGFDLEMGKWLKQITSHNQ